MSKPRRRPLGDLNIVGQRVMLLRKQKGIKQKDLVAMLQSRGMDICDASMSRLEGQRRKVLDYELPVIADALGMSVSWLLGEAQ